MFSERELKHASGDFSLDDFAKGGFATAYLGVLSCADVAVKLLSKVSCVVC